MEGNGPASPDLREIGLILASDRAFIHGKTLLPPQADPGLCTGCGTCVDQCPVSALTLEDLLPRVKEDTCITCYCCQEICPEKAMSLR